MNGGANAKETVAKAGDAAVKQPGVRSSAGKVATSAVRTAAAPPVKQSSKTTANGKADAGTVSGAHNSGASKTKAEKKVATSEVQAGEIASGTQSQRKTPAAKASPPNQAGAGKSKPGVAKSRSAVLSEAAGEIIKAADRKAEPKKAAPAKKPPAKGSATGGKTASKPAAKSATTRKGAAAARPADTPTRPRPRLALGSSAAILAPAPVAVASKPRTETTAAKSGARSGAPQSGFKAGDYIVYPAHGVGQILAVEKQEVAGFALELFVITFLQDKMTLKVPLSKVLSGAIRKLSDAATVTKSLDTLTGRARIKRTMWSRRAQEYEAKINSGDLTTIAEVVRDLYRSDTQPEQSYSERQLYEAALDRMAREVAVVRKLEANEALRLIEEHLQRGRRRGGKGDAAAQDNAGQDNAGQDDDDAETGKTGTGEEGIGEAA